MEVDLTGTDSYYFGSPINDDLWLGHGSLPNYIWDRTTGLVRELGKTDPTDRYDIGKEKFPPCRSFVQTGDGAVFGTGYTGEEYPKTRIWTTDKPSKEFPNPERVYNLNNSFIDLAQSDASEAIALSTWQSYVIVHTDKRPWILVNHGSTKDGYFAQQNATPLSVSAPNHNCTRDMTGIGANWFGRDREIYNDNSLRISSPDKDFDHKRDISTSKADNIWNERMIRDSRSAHAFYDRVNSRYFVFAQLKTNSEDDYVADFPAFGCYVWCEVTKSVSGPMVFPNAIASTTGRETLQGLNCAIVATAEGGLMYTDLDLLREREEYELEDYGNPENGEFPEEDADEAFPAIETDPDEFILETEEGDQINSEGDGNGPQVPLVWLQSVSDRDEDGYLLSYAGDVYGKFSKFARTLFKNDQPAVTFNPPDIQTIQWKNATVARLEFPPEDMGRPNIEKVYKEIRLTWQRDSKCYVGVFIRTEYGQTDGYWVGNPYPDEEQLIGVNVRGRRIQVTLLVVFSNNPDAKALLRDMTIGYLPSVTAPGV